MKKSMYFSLINKASLMKVAYIFIAAIFITNFCLVYTALAEDTIGNTSSTSASDSSTGSDISATDTDSGSVIAPDSDANSDSNSDSDTEVTDESNDTTTPPADNSDSNIDQPASDNNDTPSDNPDTNQDTDINNQPENTPEVVPEVEKLVEIIIQDLPPVITILGSNPVNLTVDDTYTDAGATASDDKDGDITSKIITENNVWTHVAGTYTVDYYVTDSAAHTSTVSRTVIVAPKEVNDKPIAAPQSVNVKENTGVRIILKGSDPDQAKTKRGYPIWPLNINDIKIVTQPAHGTLVDFMFPDSNATATVIYLPRLNYVGSDSFTFSVQDNNGDWSDPAVVSITVNPSTICTLGDVTGDDKITVDDLNSVIAMLTRAVPADLSADLDGNGDIAVPDMVMTSQLVGQHQLNPAVTDAERGNCNPETNVTYSKDNGLSYNSTAVVQHGDALKIVAKFSHVIGIDYKAYLSISGGILTKGLMSRTGMDEFSYDLNSLPIYNVDPANISIMLTNERNEIGAKTLSGNSFSVNNPPKGGEGFTGGNGGSATWCESVNYGDWSSCNDGTQTRNILSLVPYNCQITDEQVAAITQSCSATPANSESLNQGSENGGQVLGVKVWAVGSLIRTPDYKIFEVKNDMKIWHIKTLRELWQKYRGLTIWNVPFETLTPYTIINK